MIRVAQEADLPAMLAIYSPYVRETAISFEYAVPTLADFTQRWREGSTHYPWLVWEQDGQVVGYAYADRPFARTAYQWLAEASIYVAAAYHRRGIATALYEALEQLLSRQGYYQLYVIIVADNEPSLAFHRQRGFAPVARFPQCGYKLGAWHDVVWLMKTLCPAQAPVAAPQAFSQLPDDSLAGILAACSCLASAVAGA